MPGRCAGRRSRRATGTTTRPAPRTGLGLAIVRAVIAAHGGTVTLAGVPGDTAFHTRLPLRTAAPGPG
ncbi:ATP-binding protein [Streptomyces violaceusniger]|uniref:ATP-binding protein n=1 Tax=Streptomyces violaceusniger TaxID=68280 RepID=UPI0036B09C79